MNSLPFLRAKLISIFALLAISAFSLDHVSAQELSSARISVDVSKGYCRIILPLPEDVGIDVRNRNGVLVASFENPMEIDTQVLVLGAPDYIALARMDVDKEALRLALKKSFKYEMSRSASHIAIDLIPKEFDGTIEPFVNPTEVAQGSEENGSATDSQPIVSSEPKVSAGSQEVPGLGVIVSESDAFSRITFEWPEMVGYDVRLEDGTIIATFNRPAKPRLARLRVDPPRQIKTARAKVVNGGLEVQIDVVPGTSFRHFRDGSSVILDVVPSREEVEVVEPTEVHEPTEGVDEHGDPIEHEESDVIEVNEEASHVEDPQQSEENHAVESETATEHGLEDTEVGAPGERASDPSNDN